MTRSFAVLLDFKVLGHFLQVNEELLMFLLKRLKVIYFINLPNNKVNFKKKIFIKLKLLIFFIKKNIFKKKNFFVLTFWPLITQI